MKTIEQKAKKVPAIRFAGFGDAWVEKKIFDVAEIVGGGTPSTANPQFWDGNIDWYAPAEINDQVFVNGSERKITKLGLENSSAKVLPANRTVLFTSRAGIGKTAILQSPAATNQGFQSLVLNDDTDTYFVYSMTDKIKAKAERIASGSTFAEISGKMLGNLELVFPSKKEQSKIGSFFSNIDSLISLEQKKYDKLTQVKKSMLEKMFPKEGATVPEIRFAGFTGNWEKRKIGDLFKITRGYVLAAPLTSETKTDEKPYPVYSSQTKNNGLMGFYRDYLYEDAITWTTDGANAGTVNYRAGKFYCTNVCGVLLTDKVTPSQMIAEALNNVAKSHVSYVGNPKLMNNVMADIEISLPIDENERKNISSYFSHLDSLISLQQRKLEKLKNIKKSLLEKMFV